MIDGVSPISVIDALVKGSDKAKIIAGNYKDLDGDYERLPLLILGCFCLLAGKFQKAVHLGERIINFWQLGDTISSLCDYWDIVELAQSSSRMVSCGWPLFTVLDLTSKDGQSDAFNIAKKTAPYACKTFSSLVNLFETLVDFGTLKGMNIHKWKIAGSLAGGIGFSHTLYTEWNENRSGVGLEIEESKRESYREQYAKQKMCDHTITICILVAKIIGFFSAIYALNGAGRIMQFIADHKRDLLFGAYVTFTAAAIASTYYGLQLDQLKEEA
ncbi:MAG: hypothetical protein KDK56_06795 [Simkania sp.]|nr:hypothetical protein [Simkania sp.]MCP5489723.1 hypothetical protein [Chlamydiales bacterium]